MLTLGSIRNPSSNATNASVSYADPDKFVEEILEKTRSILLSEVNEVYFNIFVSILVQDMMLKSCHFSCVGKRGK